MATKPPTDSTWNACDEPLLTDSDRRFLLELSQHPSAPLYNYACGDMLDGEELEWVRRFEQALKLRPPRWRPHQPPDWVGEFAQDCLTQVPHYRSYGRSSWSADLPALGRQVLRDSPDLLIPDGMDSRRKVVYHTSGTTGNTLHVASHPVTAACYLPLLRKAVELAGGRLQGGPGRVSIVLLFYQQTTLTYPSISTFLDGAGFLKLNLHPDQWRNPQHRIEYLEHYQPEIISGNPLSLAELASLKINLRPSVMISTAMALLPGDRQRLEERFQCPVIDFYSMSECRCLAARSQGEHYHLLAHDVYVEILDEAGLPCAPGERGEITLTGGRSPYLPLLRYRTGDYAAMDWDADIPYLVGLEGRAPVRFYRADGGWINNIDVTCVLSDLPLRQFSLHQRADLSLSFLFRQGEVSREELRPRLESLFDGLPLEIAVAGPGELLENKWIRYSSDLNLA